MIQVPVGPIEFASDEPRDEKGPTEYGGRAGLIQGGVGEGEVHELTGSEKRGVLVRGQATVVVDDVTGLPVIDESALAVDPVTGLEVDPEWALDGTTVRPVDPLRTADPRSGIL